MVFKYAIFLLCLESVFGYAYPYFGGSRYFPQTPSRRPAFVPIPLSIRRSDYAIPDYDDGYMTGDQDDFDFNPYQKYNPYLKYMEPPYNPYYRSSNYYLDQAPQIPRKTWDRYGYYDDSDSQDSFDEDYPYGDEPLYTDPRYDNDAKTREAFLQNLMLAQMYGDNGYTSPAYRYDTTPDDYDEGRTYDYGIPTIRANEKEKVRKYFREKDNQEVRELEELARKQGKNRKLKEKETYGKPKNPQIYKNQKMNRLLEKQAQPKARMSDEEYFNLQKQIVLNSRKNKALPVAEGLRVDKKQIYNPLSETSDFWNYEPHLSEAPTNSIKKLNMIKGAEKIQELPPTTTTTTMATTTKATPRNIAQVGQKEVVLPRPSNPARRPYPEISTRSLHPPSVYDTIKKLLDMEKDSEDKARAQPQKRFVNTDDPLTAELNGLKKLSA